MYSKINPIIIKRILLNEEMLNKFSEDELNGKKIIREKIKNKF